MFRTIVCPGIHLQMAAVKWQASSTGHASKCCATIEAPKRLKATGASRERLPYVHETLLLLVPCYALPVHT